MGETKIHTPPDSLLRPARTHLITKMLPLKLPSRGTPSGNNTASWWNLSGGEGVWSAVFQDSFVALGRCLMN